TKSIEKPKLQRLSADTLFASTMNRDTTDGRHNSW
ncbi:MAG: hypothetical protein ACI868_001624, partial [Granulosicoccus sp.]